MHSDIFTYQAITLEAALHSQHGVAVTRWKQVTMRRAREGVVEMAEDLKFTAGDFTAIQPGDVAATVMMRHPGSHDPLWEARIPSRVALDGLLTPKAAPGPFTTVEEADAWLAQPRTVSGSITVTNLTILA